MNKIALVIFSDGFSGAEKVVWQTISYLKSKADIYLITNSEIVSFYSDLLEEHKILNVGSAFGYRKNPILSRLIENRFWLIRHIWFTKFDSALTRFLQKNDIKIIHVHLDISLFYIYNFVKKHFRKGEMKILFTVHDTMPFAKETRSFVNNCKRRRLVKIVSEIDGIIFVSKYVYSVYQKYLRKNNQYRIIYNAIDIDYIKSFISQDISDGYINFLYVGGERHNKGYDIVLEVFRNLIHNHMIRNIRLTVLGFIPDNGSIRKLVRSYHLEEYVILEGYKKPPEHLKYFNGCDALIMPSRSEALGIAAIEALAMDKFVIASKAGGIPELIEDNKNGSLCNVNIHDFEDKIIQYINNYDKITLGQRSQKLSDRYSIKTFSNELIQFYSLFYYPLPPEGGSKRPAINKSPSGDPIVIGIGANN